MGWVVAVAPGLQPYIVSSRSLSGLPCGFNCLGWAGVWRAMFFLTRTLKTGSARTYDGPRPLIVLDEEQIAEVANPGQFERCLLNVTLHEASHLLPALPVALEPPDHPRFAQLHSTEWKSRGTCRRRNPVHLTTCMTIDFCADAAIYMFGRVRRASMLHGIVCCRPSFSWVSPFEFYIAMLLPEAIKMQREPFAAIEATEPPAAFMATWNSDLDYYRRFQGEL